MRQLCAPLVAALLAACGTTKNALPDGGGGPDAPDGGGPAAPDAAVVGAPDAGGEGAPDGDPATPAACPTGPAGLPCLFDQWDGLGGCDSAQVAAVGASLAARHGDLPAWYEGRALFVSRGSAAAVAGSFNGWVDGALVTAPVCGGDLYAVEAAVPSGRHAYKLVRGGAWTLDPENWAFAYDDFAGNPDGRNSVLNTYDSGLGHLVSPDELLCSAELGNCRPFTTYLPRGYGAPENAGRRYPALFMHDGQNVFDDHDCCFGHTGWEVNVTLDEEIAAGAVGEVVVVGFDHAGAGRGDEYGWAESDGGLRETFMRFQVEQVQPTAAGYWRLDADRYFTAGSSLGGQIAFLLAFAYPDVYAGAASLSGAFWPGQDTGTAVRDVAAAAGLQPVALYLDHGGSAGDGGDGYYDSIEVRDLLVELGWQRADSPDCALGAHSLCYHWEEGATHDELAWQARSWRFLRYFFPPG